MTRSPRVENILKSLPGWCSPAKCEATEKVIAETNPRVIMEIGTFGGSWLLPAALAAPEARCIGIDPYDAGTAIEGMTEAENVSWWDNQRMLEIIYNGVMDSIEALGLRNIRMYRESSKSFMEDWMDHFPDQSKLIDILHIDGNHSEIPAMRDAQLYLPKVHIGGVIICDDIGWTESGIETVKPAIEWLCANGCEWMYEVTGAAFLRKMR